MNRWAGWWILTNPRSPIPSLQSPVPNPGLPPTVSACSSQPARRRDATMSSWSCGPRAAAAPVDALAPDGRVLGPAARLFDLDVAPAGRPLGPERLPIAARRPTDLGDGLRFLGYSTDDAPLVPGDLRKVSLFWQAVGQPAAASRGRHDRLRATARAGRQRGRGLGSPARRGLPHLGVGARHVGAHPGRLPRARGAARRPLPAHRGPLPPRRRRAAQGAGRPRLPQPGHGDDPRPAA